METIDVEFEDTELLFYAFCIAVGVIFGLVVVFNT